MEQGASTWRWWCIWFVYEKKNKFDIITILAQTTYDSNGGVISEAPKSGSTRTYNQTGWYPGQQTQQIQKIAGDEREDEMEQNLGQVLSSFLNAFKTSTWKEYVFGWKNHPTYVI